MIQAIFLFVMIAKVVFIKNLKLVSIAQLAAKHALLRVSVKHVRLGMN